MMRIFKTKSFSRWAKVETVSDATLHSAVKEMQSGLVDVCLGGFVYKKRIAIRGRGKRRSGRTLVAYKRADRAFFIYGFAKNERENISPKELRALQLLAAELLRYNDQDLYKAMKFKELTEVLHNG